MEAKKTWDLVAVSSIPLIMTLGNSMLIPILPSISRELKISSFQVSMIITVYSVIAILLIPIAGFLSDRFGRKVVIIPSLILASIGGLICGLAAWFLNDGAAYWTILGGRFLQGIGAAGAFPIVLPLVGDMFKDEAKVSHALGVVETSNTFGKVLSPIVGSLLALWIWFIPFMAIPVFCLISILMVAFMVKTPQKKEEKKQTVKEFLHSLSEIAKDKGRWLAAVFAVGAICMLVLFGILFHISDILEEQYHIDGVLKGGLLAVPLSLLCLSSYLTGKFIGERKKLMKWVTFLGMALLCAALVCTALFGNGGALWLQFVWIGLSGIGIGVALPCLDAFITEGIAKKQRGTVSSVYSSMRFIGVAVGPPAVSLLIVLGHAWMYYILAGVSALGAIVTLFAIRPTTNGPAPDEKKNYEESEEDRKETRHHHGRMPAI
jgi:MFS transporter, ACDE family, multidrug resistance protein